MSELLFNRRRYKEVAALAFLLALLSSIQYWNSLESIDHAAVTTSQSRRNSITETGPRCINILAIGASVTVGSP